MGGLLFVVVLGLLTAGASLAEQRLQGAGSGVVRGVYVPAARGIFPDERWTLVFPALARGFLSAVSILKESLRPLDAQDCGQLEQVHGDTGHLPSPPVLTIPLNT